MCDVPLASLSTDFYTGGLTVLRTYSIFFWKVSQFIHRRVLEFHVPGAVLRYHSREHIKHGLNLAVGFLHGECFLHLFYIFRVSFGSLARFTVGSIIYVSSLYEAVFVVLWRYLQQRFDP